MRLPAFLLRILAAATGDDQPGGTVVVVVRRPYAYLQDELRQTFEGQGEVRVILDRRNGDRRTRHEPVPAERRQADRRRSKEVIVDVVIGE